ncbi:tRNA (adenosine(37)-N6)-threonylcarbamoyltransferase complex dimerization subunit type 1 TsaB [Chlorogloeopsis sp. ULAP01]|uniref:tRNA (adenosine(37)-N6)-threonylcarbamoyltransferase complex dimerization subunit type 1 TsaB n=1 Tax=Chlorogloeopsis sp. ULAP01 TaxID=3056483 RepID=UPI0025AA7D90|nr:tRNA (adenosine(37)-N6)-threonylcarbamoyltransferase complex dimerization subunit type 1 TsaB [Chlorogloeopsis sp. ULAP01]MDM9382692.1 tRNA (adenosine(37)-N6)-threonylcarbamoyltransferase complex dimerization subunit type 1 TsaB [Chlorogloeopsis sp. ULAP01]
MSTELEHLDSTKYGLALHTTTPELGLAISNFAGDTRYGVWNLERELSNQLHLYLTEFIKPQIWADLAFIGVAKGPGGFTGTRIGVVTARTLGQQLGIPVFAISTLAALAWQNAEYAEDYVIAVQMPAQRGQVFAAIYRPLPDASRLDVLLPDTVFSPEVWQEKLASWNTNYQLIEAKSELATTVTSILQLAYLDWHKGNRPHWSEALPYYGQHPVDM